MEITPYGICFGIGVFVTCIIGSYSSDINCSVYCWNDHAGVAMQFRAGIIHVGFCIRGASTAVRIVFA